MATIALGNATRRETGRREALKRQQQREHEKAQKKLEKELKLEADVYASLLVTCWTRLGEAHVSRNADISTDGKPVRQRKKKIQRVHFSKVFTSPERIFYKVLVNKRTMFGYRDMLPYGVKVADLISEEALYELSVACTRIVKATSDPRTGVWIIVERLQGVDGIPLHVNSKDVLPLYPEDSSKAPVVIGIGENRKTQIVDFASHPHWLVGGSSGGGKSNMVNHIISSLMRFTHPDDLKFVLIDLKRMEFGYYENAPHLEGSIIFEGEKAVEVLQNLVKEVQSRAGLMSNKAKELSQWNKLHPDQKLPRIIVVIDEFAELMLASGSKVADQVERLTTRLTNLGRAVGIHVILATQRPAVKVIPNAIKINMPLIISARVPNYAQSNVIIGSADAANLPILPGRMVYLSGSNTKVIQTPYCSDEDVIEAVKIARGRHLGLITLRGYEPTISHDHAIQFIYDWCGGTLSIERLFREFDRYAVPRAELKALIADLLEKKQVEAFGRVYEAEKHGKGYRLVMVYSPEEDSDQPAQNDFHININNTLARLTAPVRLALPAPKVEPTVITVEAVVIEPSKEETIHQFIKECCMISPRSKSTAKKLLETYRKWCEDRDYEAASHRRFGEALRATGFTPFQGTNGVRCWKGLEVLTEETKQVAIA